MSLSIRSAQESRDGMSSRKPFFRLDRIPNCSARAAAVVNAAHLVLQSRLPLPVSTFCRGPE
jgi:hypothetical protein